MQNLQVSSIYRLLNGKDNFTAKFLGFLPNACSDFIALFSICMDGEDIAINMEGNEGWQIDEINNSSL